MRRLALPALAVAASFGYFALAVAIGFGWMANKSFAQAASETLVDIRPLVNEFVVPFLSAAILTLGSYLLLRLRRWLGIQDNDRLAHLADQALRNAVTYAENVAQSHVMSAKWSQADVKSKTLATAVRYASEQIPATLKKLGYDPATEEGRKAIERLIVARLPRSDVPPGLPGL